MTGLSFKVQTGTSYAAAIEAMGAGKAQIGFLSTFAILIAEEKYGVVPALANLRKYSTNDVDPDKDLKGQLEPFYKGQFITSDPTVKQLTDLKGKSFCLRRPDLRLRLHHPAHPAQGRGRPIRTKTSKRRPTPGRTPTLRSRSIKATAMRALPSST